MIKSYIRIAWRNLFRDKSSSFINISGLAVGMAVAMLIGLWIYDELSFDRYHADHGRIGRVMQQQTFNGVVHTEESLPFPLGAALQAQYGSDFDEIVMASWEDDHILSVGDKHAVTENDRGRLQGIGRARKYYAGSLYSKSHIWENRCDGAIDEDR